MGVQWVRARGALVLCDGGREISGFITGGSYALFYRLWNRACAVRAHSSLQTFLVCVTADTPGRGIGATSGTPWIPARLYSPSKSPDMRGTLVDGGTVVVTYVDVDNGTRVLFGTGAGPGHVPLLPAINTAAWQVPSLLGADGMLRTHRRLVVSTELLG